MCWGIGEVQDRWGAVDAISYGVMRGWVGKSTYNKLGGKWLAFGFYSSSFLAILLLYLFSHFFFFSSSLPLIEREGPQLECPVHCSYHSLDTILEPYR